MSKIKMILAGVTLATASLVTAAQADSLRIGNSSTWVDTQPSNDSAASSAYGSARVPRPVVVAPRPAEPASTKSITDPSNFGHN